MTETCKPVVARWGSLMVVAALAGAGSIHGATSAAAPRTESLTVNFPRPLAEVADQLEKRFGVPVTYEDPPYLYPGDIVDLRLQPFESHVDRDHPTWIPRLGRIDLTYTLSDTRNLDELAAALEQAIVAHTDNGNAGSFRLERRGEILSLIPIATTGPDGRQRLIEPLLDTEISLPAGSRPSRELLDLVMAEIHRRCECKVYLPFSLGMVRPVDSPGIPEPARDALRRLLAAQPMKLTWRLFYDPQSSAYFLSIVPAPH